MAAGQDGAVAERRELEGLQSAVAAADDTDLVVVDEAFVGEQAGEVLGVVDFVPDVGEVGPALLALCCRA